jgi:hypothetical protein
MGGNECWEAIGPAQELFRQVSKKIADLLDERIDDLEEGELHAGVFVTFGMYMIGKSPAAARPTLIISCQSAKPRRRAIKFIKESLILKGYPKMELAESSICPTSISNDSLRLFSGRGSPSLPNRMDLEVGDGSSPVNPLATSLNRVCGIPIICLSSGKQTTIGGVVCINGKVYGLTVAHAFEKSRYDVAKAGLNQDSVTLEGDSEFAFDIEDDEAVSDSDDGSLSEIGLSDIIMTSQGTI